MDGDAAGGPPGKDGDRNDDKTKEVLDGNNGNDATTGNVNNDADGDAVSGLPALSTREGPQPAPIAPQPPKGRFAGGYRAPPEGAR